jgi:hypothetical protein
MDSTIHGYLYNDCDVDRRCLRTGAEPETVVRKTEVALDWSDTAGFCDDGDEHSGFIISFMFLWNAL